MAPSPVVARWELSRRLAARRKELRVDVKTIAGALDFSRNYWSAVENDRTLIAKDKLEKLFEVLDFDEQDRAELLQLREDSRTRGWWDEYPSLRDEHKRFYGMEAGATRIRAYDGHLIPGILQTDPYARMIFAADPSFSSMEVERVTEARRERQSRLLASNRPSLFVLLSEAALRQQVAGPEVQVEQLNEVARFVAAEDVDLTVRILPFGIYPGAIIRSTTLHFLEYESPHLPAVAWQEGVQLFGAINEDDERYRRLDFAWQDALQRALDQKESLEMLRRTIEEFDDLAASR